MCAARSGCRHACLHAWVVPAGICRPAGIALRWPAGCWEPGWAGLALAASSVCLICPLLPCCCSLAMNAHTYFLQALHKVGPRGAGQAAWGQRQRSAAGAPSQLCLLARLHSRRNPSARAAVPSFLSLYLPLKPALESLAGGLCRVVNAPPPQQCASLTPKPASSHSRPHSHPYNQPHNHHPQPLPARTPAPCRPTGCAPTRCT